MLIVPTLHPGLLFRSGDEGFAKLEVAVREDMRKAKRLSTSVETWDESPIWEIDSVGRLRWLFPKVEDVGQFMGPIFQAMAENRYCPLTFDVETSGEHQLDCKLLCVGLGYIDPFETERLNRPVRRVCNVPLLNPGGAPYWSPHDEWVIREYLRMLLSNPYITKRCHNGAFDTVVMWAQGIPVHGWREDTMQLHHCVDSELPQNLGFVGSRFTDGRYWKDDVKGGLGWLHMDAKTLRSYNLRDVLVTIDVHEPLLREAQQLGVVHVYEQEVKLAQLMSRATIRGVYVDPERRDSEALDDKGKPVGLAPQLRAQSAESLAALRQIAGPSFDPGKPVQLRWLLYDKLGLPVVKETKSGLPATDKEAFMLLDAAADSDEQKAAIRAITKWRQAEKFMGTFVKGLDVLKDGRFHPSWKVLTTTGRLASSPNFQNLPGRVKKIFRSSPGYKLVGVDLSQAELRLIAYYANEKSLLEMYEKDINVHTVNASLLFKLQCPPEAADNINPQTEEYLRRAVVEQLGLPPGSYDSFPVVPKAKWKPVRTLAKNYEFGSAYGAIEETLYTVLRSKRDADSNELLFPTITLSQVQALRVIWKRLRPGLLRFWELICQSTERHGMYVCPIGGRVRRYRGGFKRNEMLNGPIQTGVASHMNERMLMIQDIFDRETGGAALVVQQVHDALTVEAPDDYGKRAMQVLQEVLSEPFNINPVPGISQAIPARRGARLPADTALINDFLDKT